MLIQLFTKGLFRPNCVSERSDTASLPGRRSTAGARPGEGMHYAGTIVVRLRV